MQVGMCQMKPESRRRGWGEAHHHAAHREPSDDQRSEHPGPAGSVPEAERQQRQASYGGRHHRGGLLQAREQFHRFGHGSSICLRETPPPPSAHN